MTVSQSSITSVAARGSFLRQGLKGLCSLEKKAMPAADGPASANSAPQAAPGRNHDCAS
ncbi:hypothetical protein [Desulfocurvus vexinensis]|uniref:hypothetical protein n=1 Tax=Desulfocurvus vexinensis TaxID=399548 RepID=UPI0004B20B78|nr:hypothetical protein [Desulfocurvus vexinensis]